MEHAEVLAAFEKEAAFSATLAQTIALLTAVDDNDLPERPSLLAKWIIRLSYGNGQTRVRIARQEDLAELSGIGKNKIAAGLYFLTDAKILQIHPETDVYEILPNVAEWKVRPRCRYGAQHALALAVEIAQEDRRRRSEQIDMGEVERSFQPEPTLRQIIGQNARDEAFAPAPGKSLESSESLDQAPSGPGAGGVTQSPNPPGIIGTEEPAGSRRPSEAARQVSESGGPKVTFKGTSAPKSSAPGQPKVPLKGTFGAGEASEAGQKCPKRELSSCARASDDPDHPVIPYHPESSSASGTLSSDDPDHPDEADERRGAGKRRMMVGLDDELLGDMQRQVELGHHAWFWREAIAACRRAAAHALDAIKYARRGNPGGYMRTAFYNEADRLGVKLPANLEHRRPARRMPGPRGGKS